MGAGYGLFAGWAVSAKCFKFPVMLCGGWCGLTLVEIFSGVLAGILRLWSVGMAVEGQDRSCKLPLRQLLPSSPLTNHHHHHHRV
jgi:hypothetical protein